MPGRDTVYVWIGRTAGDQPEVTRRLLLRTVVALLGVWGLVATAAPVGWWSWIAQAHPANAEAGGGLMVAVIQLAIALGSTVGGLLFDASGYRSTFVASAAVLVVAGLLAIATSRTSAVK